MSQVDAHGGPGAPAPLDVNVRPVPADPAAAHLGRDAARWALLHPAAHDRPRIDADHLVQRESNPLFRVRYAHARTRALSRNAADLGFHAEPGDDVRRPARSSPPSPTTPASSPSRSAPPPRPPRPAPRHRRRRRPRPSSPPSLPRGDEKPSAAHRARLALAEAAGTVLAGGLSLLGIDAPEHL